MVCFRENIREKNNSRGFSILEVVIAVGIISVSFVALASLFAYNIKMEILCRDKIIASYLAQEAFEVVRQIRDDNWFKGSDWLDGIPVNTDNNIIIYNEDTTEWDISAANELKKGVYLTSNGRYIQSGSSAVPPGASVSVFKRTLDFDYDPLVSQRFKITVKVQYGNSQNLELTSYLYTGWY